MYSDHLQQLHYSSHNNTRGDVKKRPALFLGDALT